MSNTNSNFLLKTQAHTEALIGYVLDAKPYHVKLSGITERYDISDEISVVTSDHMTTKIFVGADMLDPAFANRPTSNSWWKKIISDSSTRTWQIPTIGAHKYESELITKTLVAGIDDVSTIQGIDGSSSFVFSGRRHDGPSICDVRKNGVQQQESVDYHLSNGSLSISVSADGTWLERFVTGAIPRNSGVPVYDDVARVGASITNISGGNYDLWTLTCTNAATGQLSVTGKYTGNIGTVLPGATFSNANISFSYFGDLTLPLNAKIILAPRNKFVAASASTPQTWTIIKTNPLAIASKAVFTAASSTPSRNPSVHIHAGSLARATAAATWKIQFTSSTTYNLVKTGSDPLTVTGIDLKDGCSFKNDQIHFTIHPAAEGFFTGDKFEFSTVPSTGEYLVFGSVSGWSTPAKVGEWYWNGHIGFMVPKLQYFAKTATSDWEPLSLLAQSGWFFPVKDVHPGAMPSVYTITFQSPVAPATTVTHATVHNNVYGFRAGLTIDEVWEDEFCSFTITPDSVSAGDTFKVYLAETKGSMVVAEYDDAGYEVALYDYGAIDVETPTNLLQAKYPLPDNHGSVIFKTGCFTSDEIVINVSLMDLFRLQIGGADTLFPELASQANWVPLEFRYFDRIDSSSPEGAIAYFPDVSTTIEAYLCSAPTVKVLTITQPRFQCTSRNSSAIATFDSSFFSKYLKFGTKFSFSVAQESPLGQRAKVSIGESLSIQLVDLSPPVPTDPYFGDVVLLLHMDGENEGTVLSDSSSSPKTVISQGNAQTSDSHVKFGETSLYLDGAGDALTVPSSVDFDFGIGDFTIEGFFYRVGPGSGDRFLVDRGNGNQFLLRWSSSGNLQVWILSTLICTYTFDFSVGNWYHIAVARNEGTVNLFVNGTNVASGFCIVDMVGSTSPVYIGAYNAGTGDNFNGYVDELRITKGVARYTADFTPPTEPFPDSGMSAEPVGDPYTEPSPDGGVPTVPTDPYFDDVALLLHMDGGEGSTVFTDNSPTPKVVTPISSAQIKTDHYLFGGASAHFGGAGSSASAAVASSNDFSLGTGDFTIEISTRYTGGPTGIYDTLFFLGDGSQRIEIRLSDSGFSFALQLNLGAGTTISDVLTVTGQTRTTMQDVWTSIVITRAAGITRVFINGNLSGSTTWAYDIAGTASVRLASNLSGEQLYPGYIDEIRITKGVARYTADFTPPTAPFPDSGP